MNFLEISHWCNPRSLLVISELGILKRLDCPILVICIKIVGDLHEHQLYKVNKIKMTEHGILVFDVEGCLFFHSTFRIIEQ